MRWNAVKKKIIFTAYFWHLFAVNAVNRGELFFFTAFLVALNYSFSPLNAMNYFFSPHLAVKKNYSPLERKWWIIFFHRIHRNHRISYENSPHSPHFLRKFTQKPRPGMPLFGQPMVDHDTNRSNRGTTATRICQTMVNLWASINQCMVGQPRPSLVTSWLTLA